MPSYPLACAALLVLGFAGGLFTVPLHALLQQKPAVGEKGSVFAVSNLLSTVAILLASGSMWYLDRVAGVAPDRVILVFGVFQLVASGYVLWLLPDFFLRFSLLLLTHTLYRVEAQGVEHVPARGPALLVCNHLSHVDGFLVGACVQRFIRFMVYRPYFNLPVAQPAVDDDAGDPGGGRQPAGGAGLDRAGARRARTAATSSASLPRARSAAPATCCRSSAASSASSTGWTSR